MKKFGVLIFILLLVSFSFVFAQEGEGNDMPDPGVAVSTSDVEALNKLGDQAGQIVEGNFTGYKDNATRRIEAIELWTEQNTPWLKLFFGMTPKLSWLFAINFLLILILIVYFRNILVFYSSFSESSSTLIGVALAIMAVQLQVTVKSATWMLGLWLSWPGWLRSIIIFLVVGAFLGVGFFLGKIAKRKRLKMSEAKIHEGAKKAEVIGGFTDKLARQDKK